MTVNNRDVGLYCTGVGEVFKHRWLLDATCKQLDQLAVHSEKINKGFCLKRNVMSVQLFDNIKSKRLPEGRGT